MRKTALAAAVLILAGTAASMEYSTVVFDSDLNEHYRVQGYVNSVSTNQVSIVAKYNLTLTHRYLNSSEVDRLEYVFLDGNTTVAKGSAGGFSLDHGNSTAGILEIESDRSPHRIESLRIGVLHSGKDGSGDSISFYVNQTLDYTPTERDPEILELEPGSPTLEPGENLTLEARTRGITSLELNGTNMSYSGGDRFTAEIASGQVENGSNPVSLQTGRGEEFIETVEITVDNSTGENGEEQRLDRELNSSSTGTGNNSSSTSGSSKLEQALQDEDAKSFPAVVIDPIMKWLGSVF